MDAESLCQVAALFQSEYPHATYDDIFKTFKTGQNYLINVSREHHYSIRDARETLAVFLKCRPPKDLAVIVLRSVVEQGAVCEVFPWRNLPRFSSEEAKFFFEMIYDLLVYVGFGYAPLLRIQPSSAEPLPDEFEIHEFDGHWDWNDIVPRFFHTVNDKRWPNPYHIASIASDKVVIQIQQAVVNFAFMCSRGPRYFSANGILMAMECAADSIYDYCMAEDRMRTGRDKYEAFQKCSSSLAFVVRRCNRLWRTAFYDKVEKTFYDDETFERHMRKWLGMFQNSSRAFGMAKLVRETTRYFGMRYTKLDNDYMRNISQLIFPNCEADTIRFERDLYLILLSNRHLLSSHLLHTDFIFPEPSIVDDEEPTTAKQPKLSVL